MASAGRATAATWRPAAHRDRRGGRHHRRPVDRRARHPADDADVPHRRRGRPRHHRGPAAGRGAVRGPGPEGQGRDQPHRWRRRGGPRHPDAVKVVSREAYDTSLTFRRCRGPARPGRTVTANQVLARARQGRPTEVQAGRRDLSRTATRRRPGEEEVEREYRHPPRREAEGREAGEEIRPAPRSPTANRSAGVPRHRARTPSSADLVKEVQKVYRSQGVTMNDKHIEIDRPADAPEGPDRPARRRRPPADELIEGLRVEEANDWVLAEGGEPRRPNRPAG